MGLYPLREAVQATTELSRGFRPDIDQILVTPGANAIIYLAISCVVDPGEEVLVPDPGFPTYLAAIKYCGARAVAVPVRESNHFRLDPQDVRDRITDRTRLLIINSPSNPTGGVMLPDEIDEIARIAKEKDIYLLSDEIYARMVFAEETTFHSPASLDQCRERTIIVNGFSKSFAMTGWRLGVAIGPQEVITKMGLVLQTIVSCVPPFVQEAGIEAIQGDQSAIVAMRNEYRLRRDVLVRGLNQLPGVSCCLPQGAMYAFPNIGGTNMSSEEFAEFALDKAGVALLPGTHFGEHGAGFARLCYVNTLENIKLAIQQLAAALKERGV